LPDEDGNVDFIVNKTIGNFIRLGCANTRYVRNAVHKFLCDNGIWNIQHKVILAKRKINFIPDKNIYHDITFVLSFYKKNCIEQPNIPPKSIDKILQFVMLIDLLQLSPTYDDKNNYQRKLKLSDFNNQLNQHNWLSTLKIISNIEIYSEYESCILSFVQNNLGKKIFMNFFDLNEISEQINNKDLMKKIIDTVTTKLIENCKDS